MSIGSRVPWEWDFVRATRIKLRAFATDLALHYALQRWSTRHHRAGHNPLGSEDQHGNADGRWIFAARSRMNKE